MKTAENMALPENNWEGFSLSFQQQQLIKQTTRNSPQYFSATYSLSGSLDPNRLIAALSTLINEHEILRTSFRNVLGENSDVLMVINDPYQPELIMADGEPSDVNPFNEEEAASACASPTARERPLKAALYRITADRHTLVISLPTASLDYASADAMMAALSRLYAGEAGTSSPIVQYADFAQWQREDFPPQTTITHVEPIPSLRLPLEFKSDSQDWQCRPITLTMETQSQLQALATENALSLRALLYACWSAALWRIAEYPDRFVLSTNLAGRPFAELQQALGRFEYAVHTIAQPNADMTLLQFAEHCQQALRLSEQQDGRQPGDVHSAGEIGYQFFNAASAIETPLLHWENRTAIPVPEHCRLSLQVNAGERFHLVLLIQQGVFDAAGIATIEQAFRATLQALLKTPQAMLDRFPLMTDDETRILIENTHNALSSSPALGCWYHTFSRQASQTPDAPALKYNSRIWRYAELDAFTNQLARHLLNNGVEQGAAIGLMLERSDLALAAIIAIHKAGACYVPLDPQLPQQRVEIILKQTRPALMLVAQAQHRQAQLTLPAMALDEQWNDISVLDDSALPFTASADSLAYVLYTSGSTGEPKGVKIAHHQLQNYVSGIIERAELGAALTYLSIGPITTDLGNTTLFPALVTGGCIDISPFTHAEDIQEQIRYMEQSEYDVLKLTPSHMASLFALADTPARLMPGKALLLGGEVLSWGMWRLFNDFENGCRIYNHYGPTETCVGAIAQQVASDKYARLASTVPLGTPLPHARCYVVDPHGALLPVGVAGELYIGGETVACGYVQSAEDQRPRFIADPWSPRSNARLYRSGDKVRRLPDGSLEFLGRIDRQLKIRGFRVEPAEIESTLRKHAEVLDSCVVEQGESGSAHLLAYVVLQSGDNGNADWLREHLAAYLPDFMIPSQIVSLSRFPLNYNGKVDHRMLPAPDTLIAANADDYVAPQSETEKSVAAIFHKLLLANRVGIHDDFFDIGGHSLIATKLVAQIRSTFDIPFNLRSVFMDATVAGLSRNIDEQRHSQEMAK